MVMIVVVMGVVLVEGAVTVVVTGRVRVVVTETVLVSVTVLGGGGAAETKTSSAVHRTCPISRFVHALSTFGLFARRILTVVPAARAILSQV